MLERPIFSSANLESLESPRSLLYPAAISFSQRSVTDRPRGLDSRPRETVDEPEADDLTNSRELSLGSARMNGTLSSEHDMVLQGEKRKRREEEKKRRREDEEKKRRREEEEKRRREEKKRREEEKRRREEEEKKKRRRRRREAPTKIRANHHKQIEISSEK